MKKIFLSILPFFVVFSLLAQQSAYITGPTVTAGTGVYVGLNKIPQNCATAIGNFYVSSADDHAGIKWFTNTTNSLNSLSRVDGLLNSKTLIAQTYNGVNINVNGLANLLSSYPVGLSGTPAGAVEVCFQKNYSNGSLVAGTTVANMWYLPASDQLKAICNAVATNSTVFTGVFGSEYYWSSTEYSSSEAIGTRNSSNTTVSLSKGTISKVRCIRNGVSTKLTYPATNITSSAATTAGMVTLDDGSTVTEKGICWNTLQYPTISANKIACGSGDGQFSKTLTGLIPNTTYYFRVYSTSGTTTTYGNQEVFRTSAACGAYVASGIWREFMCYNLGADVSYDYNRLCQQTMGDYYQWGKISSCATAATSSSAISGWSTVAAANGSWSSSGKTANDPCPNGYRVPSKSEWQGVITNNTKTNIPTTWGSAGSTQYANGIKLGSSLVLSAAGSRSNVDGYLGGRGQAGVYWCNDDNGKSEFAFMASVITTQYSANALAGCSVRCIKDSTPVVTTANASRVSDNSFTIGGYVAADGGSPILARGFCWSSLQNPTIANSTSSNGTGIGYFSATLPGNSVLFIPGATFYVKAYAINAKGISYGEQVKVVTLGYIQPFDPDTGVIDTASPL